MTGPAPFALTSSPHGATEPSSLHLRLEILRLQAELESLETRIAELDDPSAVTTAVEPATDDGADELVERMVASLLQAGRDEIDAASSRRRAEAEAELDEARRSADLVLDRARADLAVALAERERAVGTALDDGLDLVVLSDAELQAPIPAPAPVAMAPAPVQVPDAMAPTPEPVIAPAPVAVAPVVADGHPVGPAGPNAMDAEEARTDAAFDVWMAVAPEPVAEVAPETTTSALEPVPATSPALDGPRSRWLLPLEVIAALLAAMIVVVLILVLVG